MQGTRVSRPRVRRGRAGGSVTRRQAEWAERTGRGGAEASAAQPLPAWPSTPDRPGSMDRSSLLQLIQEQVRWGRGARAPPLPLGWAGKWNWQSLSPTPAPVHSSNPLMHDLGPLPETPGGGEPDQGARGGARGGGDSPQTSALSFQDGQSQNEVRRPLEAWGLRNRFPGSS